MKLRSLFNTTAIAIAIVVIIISTGVLSLFSYRATQGGGRVAAETIQVQTQLAARQAVDAIEQKIIYNDKTLADSINVDDPSKWESEVEAIKSNPDLNLEQVYILRLARFQKGDSGHNYPLFPAYSFAIRNSWGAYQKYFTLKDLNPANFVLNQVNHLHKEKAANYFFASYVVKQDENGDQFLICFQMNKDKITALLIDMLRSIQTSYYTSIVDYENNGVYNQPLLGFSKSYSEQRFPSTFYKWILQAVPRNYNELEREVRNQRSTNLFFIIVSMSLILFSLAVIYGAVSRERQLRQLKEDFISNVSHELKTPLSLIRMFSEILVTGRVKSEEAKREYYSVIHNESDRMGRLVNNLLDFGSLEKDKKRKYFEKVNIPGLVKKALEAYRYEFQKEGFQLVSEIDESVPDTLADPNAISMALFNLLDNSVKYSADQKEIRVAVSATNGEIRISVADRGLGIPAAEQQRIFEKFYRGSSAQVKKTRGSGIGLAITKQVAEMHGGEVLLESEPGNGSTFTLTIPIRMLQKADRVMEARAGSRH